MNHSESLPLRPRSSPNPCSRLPLHTRRLARLAGAARGRGRRGGVDPLYLLVLLTRVQRTRQPDGCHRSEDKMKSRPPQPHNISLFLQPIRDFGCPVTGWHLDQSYLKAPSGQQRTEIHKDEGRPPQNQERALWVRPNKGRRLSVARIFPSRAPYRSME
jgi:hypothetical protein